MKKQHDILSFKWQDDTLFDKWMEDYVNAKNLQLDENDDDQDEVQIIDTSIQV